MHPLYKQLSQTVLGRLRTQLLSMISGSTDTIPSERAFWQYLLREWKYNDYARFLFFISQTSTINKVHLRFPVSSKDIEKVLEKLSRAKPIKSIFAETEFNPSENLFELGCLAISEEDEDGNTVYYALILDERIFPNSAMGFVSIRPSKNSHEDAIAVLGDTGWKNISPEKAGTIPIICLVIEMFRTHFDRQSVKYVPKEEINVDPYWVPSPDSNCDKLLEQVARNEIATTLAIVPFDLVTPADLDFCLKLSKDKRFLEISENDAMLVYWCNGSFVMSDDYPVYLAHRRRESLEAVVVVLGDFPRDKGKVLKVGGVELLPPCRTVLRPLLIGANDEFKRWQLKTSLSEDKRQAVPADLLARWIGFADLLRQTETDEKRIHSYIKTFPVVLSAYGKDLLSEVMLGNRYRVDLLVKNATNLDEVVLVELESPRHQLFTKSGRLRAEITHAFQQVEDWIRWWRENPTDPLAQSTSGRTRKGWW